MRLATSSYRLFRQALSAALLRLLCSSAGIAEVNPLITTDWKVFQWPYNACFPLEPEGPGIQGHIGNACGPTAMAQLMRYWNYPPRGNGSLAFDDARGVHWEANFDDTEYNWENMPQRLEYGDPESIYLPIATFMMHCAVSTHDLHGTGMSLQVLTEAMQQHFLYSSHAVVLFRDDYSEAEWDQIFRDELDAARPILIEGWGPNSAPPGQPGNHDGHYFLCDGYNDEGLFHIVWDYGNWDGWFPLYHFASESEGDYSAWNWALIGFQPEGSGVEGRDRLPSVIDWSLGPVWPNPCNPSVNIRIQSSTRTNFRYSISDVLGRRVGRSDDFTVTSGAEVLRISLDGLSSGRYFIEIRDHQNSRTVPVQLTR